MASNFFSKACSTSTGSADPPEMQVRRLLVSAVASVSSRAPYMVGTPSKIVTRCSSMIFRTAAGSKRGISASDAPDTTAALSPQVSPKTWNSGRQPMITSSGVVRMRASTVVRALESRLWCVSIAPLGCPVVPEV